MDLCSSIEIPLPGSGPQQSVPARLRWTERLTPSGRRGTVTVPSFGSDRGDALPPLGEDVPDPEHPGRPGTDDPDVRDAWPEPDDALVTRPDDDSLYP